MHWKGYLSIYINSSHISPYTLTPPDMHQTMSDRLEVDPDFWRPRTDKRTKVFQEVLTDLKMISKVIRRKSRRPGATSISDDLVTQPNSGSLLQYQSKLKQLTIIHGRCWSVPTSSDLIAMFDLNPPPTLWEYLLYYQILLVMLENCGRF